ncbi:PP2C family protein-serine/threonine phosphatase [Zavarzinia sp. CC-PAN008]|uniref:PP2C family protein-serine/threonine phosphatase n=1 Tax=Zavarzinia sp. CC-PAN008 TaxID=3243332 RepID=UPI003F74533F
MAFPAPADPDAASGPGSAARGVPGRRRGLTARQAVVTFLVALGFGLITSGLELYFDWRSMRAAARAELVETAATVGSSADEAAFQMSAPLAAQIVDGLFRRETVARVRMVDNFGNVLAERQREGGTGANPLADALFGDVVSITRPLTYGATRDDVGRMEIALSPELVASGFFQRAATNAGIGLARAFAIAGVLIGIFYLMITRPLVRLSAAIGRIDPARPGAHLVPQIRDHADDELGSLVTSLNALLAESQAGLDARDRAEGQLTDLTRTLEARVVERTQALEESNQALSVGKAQTEQALAALNSAHAQLDEANRLLLESLRYARRIQTAQLPQAADLAGLVRDIAVMWQPLHLVGGDYYWLEQIDGRAYVVLADCTGHGVPGAFVTLVVAAALDRVLHERRLRDPVEVLEALDALVRSGLRQDRSDGLGGDADDGFDAACLVIDPADRTAHYASAGLPLLVCRDGVVAELKGDRRSLGYRQVGDAAPLTSHAIPLEPGLSLFMMTDGVPDQMGGSPRRLMGRKRLARLLERTAGQPMATRLAGIESDLATYRGEERLRDDMSLIGIQPL